MFWKRLFGTKGAKQTNADRRRVEELHGQAIRYVTERNGDNDDVIGRGGSLSVRGGELILFSSADILLRSNVTETQVSHLMSGDGVVITAPNLEENGRVRTVIAHYVYHRK